LVFIEGSQFRPGLDLDHDIGRLIEILSRLILKRAYELWDKGHWEEARDEFSYVLERMRRKTRERRRIENKLEVAQQLCQALGDLKENEFESAKTCLGRIADRDGPVILPTVKELATIGAWVSSVNRAAGPSESRWSDRLDEILKQEQRLDDIASRRAPDTILPGEQQVRSLLRETLLEVKYRLALELYAQGWFTRAKTIFEELGKYKDANDRASLCQIWILFHEKLRERKWAEAAELRRCLNLKDREPWTQARRRWWNQVLRVGPVVEAMAAGLVRDPRVPWEGGACPYEMLRVPPTTSLQQCGELGYALQAKPGGMTPAETAALDTLRVVERRLLVDFSLYSVRDPQRAREVLERFFIAEEGREPWTALQPAAGAPGGYMPGVPVREAIAGALGEDEGIFYALAEDYDSALRVFEREAQARPWDPTNLHRIGLAAAGKIARGSEAWSPLLLAWGAVFADDRFWHGWWAARRECYQVSSELMSSEQIYDARLRLRRFWMEELKSKFLDDPQMEARFQAELNGARAVHAGGGIVLGDSGIERAVLGLLAARSLGLSDAVARWIASFGPDCLREEGWQRRACLYFSELAEALALFEDGRLEDAIAALSPAGLRVGFEFEHANPGLARFEHRAALLRASRLELLEEAHCKVALAAVSEFPINIDKTLPHWRSAIALATQRGSAEGVLSRIRDIAVGRAEALRQHAGPSRMDALNDAVGLLQDIHGEGWDNEEQAIQKALVEALLDRAVYLSNEHDLEREARRDALEAWTMAPKSLRAIHTLSGASLHYARELLLQGQRDLVEALLDEVDGYVTDGQSLYPENPDLTMASAGAAELRRILAGKGKQGPEERRNSGSRYSLHHREKAESAMNTELNSCKQFRDALKDPGPGTIGPEQRQADNRLADAALQEARKEFAAAIETYWALVRSSPSDRSLRLHMALCYRNWLQYLLHTSAPPSEVRRILREARERCPGSEALSDLTGELLDDDMEA
jgi:hypothetical protein